MKAFEAGLMRALRHKYQGGGGVGGRWVELRGAGVGSVPRGAGRGGGRGGPRGRAGERCRGARPRSAVTEWNPSRYICLPSSLTLTHSLSHFHTLLLFPSYFTYKETLPPLATVETSVVAPHLCLTHSLSFSLSFAVSVPPSVPLGVFV